MGINFFRQFHSKFISFFRCGQVQLQDFSRLGNGHSLNHQRKKGDEEYNVEQLL